MILHHFWAALPFALKALGVLVPMCFIAAIIVSFSGPSEGGIKGPTDRHLIILLAICTAIVTVLAWRAGR